MYILFVKLFSKWKSICDERFIHVHAIQLSSIYSLVILTIFPYQCTMNYVNHNIVVTLITLNWLPFSYCRSSSIAVSIRSKLFHRSIYWNLLIVVQRDIPFCLHQEQDNHIDNAVDCVHSNVDTFRMNCYNYES